MKLFNTPRWKHRKPEIRLQAITELSSSGRDDVLAELASNDSDALVRQAAVKLIVDLDLLGTLSGDADAGLARLADSRLRQLLCGRTDIVIAVEHRQRYVRLCKNASLLDHVIFNSDDDNLKRHAFNAALELSNGTGLLQKVATQATSAELRLYAVEKISQGSTLKQIIDPLKKIDKAASRLAQNKLDEIQLRAGDKATMQRHQLALCEDIEALNNAIPTTAQVEQLKQQWDKLTSLSPDSVCKETSERFGRGIRIAEHIINPPAPPVEIAEESSIGVATPEPSSATPAENEAEIQKKNADHAAALANAIHRCEQLLNNPQSKSTVKQLTAARKTLTQALSHISDDIQAEPGRVLSSIIKDRLDGLNSQRNEALATATTSIQALAQHISNNAAGPARDAHRALVNALKSARSIAPGDDINSLSDKLSTLDPDYHKLTEAQHWSTSRVRRELVDKAEKLVDAVMPPAELATIIKEIQAEWKKLDQIEHDQGPNALRGRFSSACRKAWEPCAAYYASRDEQRKGDLAVVAQFIDQLQALDPSQLKLNALLDKVELGGKVDRELRSYPAKIRGDWPQKLRAALKPLEKSRDRQWAANAAAKQQMIDAAKALESLDDLRKATDQMKRLQADWKKIGPTKRKQNNALWEQFRAAGDAVFNRAKQANNQRRAEQDKQGEFIKQQIHNVTNLLEDTGAANQLKQKLADIQRDTSDALNEAGKHPAAKAFSDAAAKVNKLIAQRQREEALTALEPLRKAAQAKSASATEDTAARDAVLLMEIAAGVESPADDSARRMELQLGLLSSNFGRNADSGDKTILSMVEAWYKEHNAPSATWAELDARVQIVAQSH